ncbi:OsmC family protein [Pedococcus sp. 5OH_020]|uniref:OsmC family protein n=1 Tax=Pedococcus sp. 5OH_020 TaxID=2989814 RepID=UPI0022EA0E7D|nr:OsmC family protein [Pedococcus sp. 5OH_020]
MVQTHIYRAEVQWSGSTALGYPSYRRAHSAFLPPATEGFDLSADPHFRGDPDLPNPEQLLVLAASSCQLLSFLAVAARRKVDVLRYEDDAVGEMPQDSVPLRITRIVLRPRVTVSADTDRRLVERLLLEAHEQCYISNSLTTQVTVEGAVTVSGPD